ncbi:hypothetical protein LVY72_10385 [Arthrobacter sp. I2-34]|uniref:Uncharacterized protein n=1 Tax=Arthrobacter hankyongi TaxID=2904801 RepID=A0ABS9L6N8_9MICC|nr:hypothetical protein [Arthrobacter hankyongi]MCG2622324.1 hypothetical protein [Arthrobacter hankyongi]
MSESAWESIDGQLWWPWPLDEAGVTALVRELADRSLVGAFAGGSPRAGQTVVGVILARDPAGRVAVLDAAGEAVPGPDYRMAAQGLALALGAAVELDDFDFEAPAADAALELENEPELPEPPEDEVDDSSLRTVLVGRFREADLALFGALNHVDLHVLDGATPDGRSLALIRGEAAPGLYNWPVEAKPMVALMNLDGFRALEAWLPGSRKDPAISFWHAWEPPAKPFPSTSRASASSLRLLGRLVRPGSPDTGRLAASLGLAPAAVARLQELFSEQDGPSVLVEAARLLGLPELAGQLAEGSVEPQAVANMTCLPQVPLGRAILELMSTPASGGSPVAAWHRAVLARPSLLAGSAAVAGAAAAALYRSAIRRPAGTAGLLRAGAVTLTIQAAGDLAFFGYLKYRHRHRR